MSCCCRKQKSTVQKLEKIRVAKIKIFNTGMTADAAAESPAEATAIAAATTTTTAAAGTEETAAATTGTAIISTLLRKFENDVGRIQLTCGTV